MDEPEWIHGHDQGTTQEKSSQEGEAEFLRCWVAGFALALFVPGALLCWLAALLSSFLVLPLGADRAGLFLLCSWHWVIKLFKVTMRAMLADERGKDEAQRRDQG